MSLTTAARTARVSRSTLRRRLADGAFPSAQRDAQGQWQVPVSDLIGAGLTPSVTPPTNGPVAVSMNGAVCMPDRVAALEAELAVERMTREAAERLATERLDRVQDLRVALRAIGPGPTVLVKRHWWSRREG